MPSAKVPFFYFFFASCRLSRKVTQILSWNQKISEITCHTHFDPFVPCHLLIGFTTPLLLRGIKNQMKRLTFISMIVATVIWAIAAQLAAIRVIPVWAAVLIGILGMFLNGYIALFILRIVSGPERFTKLVANAKSEEVVNALSPEELQAFFEGLMYPPDSVLQELAQKAGDTNDTTIFITACGCCATAFLGAAHEFSFTNTEDMFSRLVDALSEQYKRNNLTVLTVEQLRQHILNAWRRINKAAIANPIGGKGSSRHAAMMAAQLVHDGDTQYTVPIFLSLMEDKYHTACGYLRVLKEKQSI
jgi:hypothetical protein